ncbi:MAG: penicillin-insensitive murein endopeptidase [Parvibaculaceae bacterium]
MRLSRWPAAVAFLLALAAVGLAPSSADDKSAMKKPPVAKSKLDRIPAKELFGAVKDPAPIAARAIGSYARGCLAGGTALPIDGPAWQVMRLSRNRNWGHPALIALVERLAKDAQEKDGWPGLLVGDLAQPRGGPMLTGHASHQIGLDADIWLTPMPNRTLTASERENISAVIMTKSHKEIDRSRWTEAHDRLIRRAASYPQVARIFVHPPIKKALCDWATGDRSWLAKVRPYWGHNYHFHVRIRCPADSPGCKDQAEPAPKDGTGCGDELAYWMQDKLWAKPTTPPKPRKPPPPLMLSALPPDCRGIISIQ